MVEKYYNEQGEVAVLYSPGYGMGWYSWYPEDPSILFDKDIVQAVLDEDILEIVNIVTYRYPDVLTGGASQLQVEWMTPGTCFNIKDFDGYERIQYCDLCHTA